MGAHTARRFPELVIHTPPHDRSATSLPWTFFHLRLPRAVRALLDDQNDCEFEIAKVNGRSWRRRRPHTDRGDPARAARPVDATALGWRRMLASSGYQPAPTRRCPAATRGAPRTGSGFRPSRLWIDPAATCRPATAGRSPARDDDAASSASARRFDPRFPTSRTTHETCSPEGSRSRRGPLSRATGSPTRSAEGHRGRRLSSRRPYSAGHCLALTRRGGYGTAFFYFGNRGSGQRSCAPSSRGASRARPGALVDYHTHLSHHAATRGNSTAMLARPVNSCHACPPRAYWRRCSTAWGTRAFVN